MKNKPGRNGKSNSADSKQTARDGLRKLFVEGLKDIYSAEKALVKAIPGMIDNATSQDLIDVLTDHMDITEDQVIRLENVFASIGEKAEAEKCEAILGLVKEAEKIMNECGKGVVRDAGIILATQKMEHYEIATYGTLCAFAEILGEHQAASLLIEILQEEKDADKKLSEIAFYSINIRAEDENYEEEDADVAVKIKSR